MEILVVITLIALLSTAVGVPVMEHLKSSRVRLAGIDAATVRQAARAFELHEGRCPSMDELLSSAALDDEARTVDPWDTPFRLECSDGPRVSSAGTGSRVRNGGRHRLDPCLAGR
jgi:type II secretory pathway pseudopilin PulG